MMVIVGLLSVLDDSLSLLYSRSNLHSCNFFRFLLLVDVSVGCSGPAKGTSMELNEWWRISTSGEDQFDPKRFFYFDIRIM